MAAINVVQRFRHNNDVRNYRRKITAEITQHLALKLLPALAQLPLAYLRANGAPCQLKDMLNEHRHVLLHGRHGSGRLLTLQQCALHWATSEELPLPVMLRLQLLDDERHPPSLLLEQALAPFHTTTDGAIGLLVDGFEMLPQVRKDAWRVALTQYLATHPQALALVASMPEEASWDGFVDVTLAPPSPALLQTWVDQLAPNSRRMVMQTVLNPRGPLSYLSEKLMDVALLAWVSPRTTMPSSRSELYTSSFAALCAVLGLNQPPAQVLKELQLLASYDEPISVAIPGLVEQAANGKWRILMPLVRSYLAARQLLAEERYDLLDHLPLSERIDVVQFLATLSDDPTPLFTALWRGGRPRADDVLALSYALRERAVSPVAWTLRIVGALALLSRDTRLPQSSAGATVLPMLMRQLDAALMTLARGNPSVLQAIQRLLNVLPPALAIPRAERLVFAPDSDLTLAWTLADMLGTRAEFWSPVPAPETEASLGRWAFTRALGGPSAHADLFAAGPGALEALATSPAGVQRKLQAATALLEDRTLLADGRVAALHLLLHNDEPEAINMIEWACYDANAVVRQTALDMLHARAPERVIATLGRTASDQNAAPEARYEALRQLCQHSERYMSLLAYCAADASLPLIARALAAAHLGDATELQALLYDPVQPLVVRAAAADALATKATDSTALVSLLEDETMPAEVTAALCHGLAQRKDQSAVAPLLRVLDRSAADVDVTLAAIDALGEIGGQEAIPALAVLVGKQAEERLRTTVAPLEMTESADLVRQRGELPSPLGMRLDELFANARTPPERPTTVGEFVHLQADIIRAAAAGALARIGGNQAIDAMLHALSTGSTSGASNQVLRALANAAPPAGLQAIAALIANSAADPLARWSAVDVLRDHPDGEAYLRNALANPEIDPFVRGALAEALGRRGSGATLPLLRQIADDPHGDTHLRSQAIIALGLLDEPEAEIVLLRMLAASTEDVSLRGLAAEHLPSNLSSEGRRFLRELLNGSRPPTPIAAGALRALGRVHDREALPVLLRYAQDDQEQVARAALNAIADIGDPSVAPVLVQTVQNTNNSAATRLQAVGTLLRIGGDTYRPLMRTYLESDTLPLRLQALEHVLDASTSNTELTGYLTDRNWPLPLRLRLIEHLANNQSSVPVMTQIARQPDEILQLRLAATNALRRWKSDLSTQALIDLAADADAPPGVRITSIAALPASTIAVGASLSSLAADPEIPVTVRRAALHALLHASRQPHTHPAEENHE